MKQYKKQRRPHLSILFMSAFIVAAVSLTACGDTNKNDTPTPSPDVLAATATPTPAAEPSPTTAATPTAGASISQTLSTATQPDGLTSTLTNFDQRTTWDETATTVVLNGDAADITGGGAAFANDTLSITAEGTYVLSGTLNGGILVTVQNTEKVQLVLNGVTITNPVGPAIGITQADKVSLTLAAGTENTLTDGTAYAAELDSRLSACIASRDDLSINGDGSLTVVGNYNNGIDTSNDLTIAGGTITVTAKNNALKGNDSVSIFDGTLTITKSDDGIKADTEDKDDKGFIYIAGGTVSIAATDDALQAYRSVRIDGGTISLQSGGKEINCGGVIWVEDGCVTLP